MWARPSGRGQPGVWDRTEVPRLDSSRFEISGKSFQGTGAGASILAKRVSAVVLPLFGLMDGSGDGGARWM
jgi:hypothetical protein